MDRVAIAETYYRAIDDGDYEELRSILAPEFVHERPDRTLEGPDRFVRFMREERPMTDTTHAIDATYRGEVEVAVRGRLRRAGEDLFGFVDVFSFEDARVSNLRTYTR